MQAQTLLFMCSKRAEQTKQLLEQQTAMVNLILRLHGIVAQITLQSFKTLLLIPTLL